MDFSKLKNRLLIVLCVLIVFLPFCLVTPVLADTEDVEVTRDYLSISSGRNYFVSSDNQNIGYFTAQKGYIYHIYNKNATTERVVVLSDNLPTVNGVYTYLTNIPVQSTYDFIATSDTIVYVSVNNPSNFTVTREKITNMDGVVNDLVDNVGLQSLWNTFNDANPFILVVVLFSFGLFIIIALVRKLRKGKGGF